MTQIISIAINNTSHPTPSGAHRVPILVLVAAAKGVGGRCVVAVARSFVGEGRARVVLAHAMAVSPAVVLGAGFLCCMNTRWSCRRSCHLSRRLRPAPTRSCRLSPAQHGVTAGVPPRQVTTSTNFLLVDVSNVMVAVGAKLAAMSCWRTMVSFVAARARLSSAVSRCPIAGAAAGITL